MARTLLYLVLHFYILYNIESYYLSGVLYIGQGRLGDQRTRSSYTVECPLSSLIGYDRRLRH